MRENARKSATRIAKRKSIERERENFVWFGFGVLVRWGVGVKSKKEKWGTKNKGNG